jgi:hypothetical protein
MSPEVMISQSDLAPKVVERADAKKKPSSKLITDTDVRRQGLLNQLDKRVKLIFTRVVRRVFCILAIMPQK